MAVKFTQWFSIDQHGNPVRRGYYEVLFASEVEPDGTTRYWDGRAWRMRENDNTSIFGLGDTRGERWRGLTAPAK